MLLTPGRAFGRLNRENQGLKHAYKGNADSRAFSRMVYAVFNQQAPPRLAFSRHSVWARPFPWCAWPFPEAPEQVHIILIQMHGLMIFSTMILWVIGIGASHA
jgi:hypothetical protein